MLMLDGALDFEKRQSFVAAAAGEIARHDNLTLDCSTVATIDDGTIGMMVTIARCAARRGGRVRLVKMPQALADALEAANVTKTFDCTTATLRDAPSEGS
jgi:anti-anti-sigma regulatory factor